MAIALVQSAARGSWTNPGTSVTATSAFSTPPAVGSKIIVAVNPWILSGAASAPTESITDNFGNTYTKRVGAVVTTADRFQAELWDCTVAASGASFTVTYHGTFSSATNDGYVQATEWSGLGAFDQVATSQAVSGTVTATTGTLANASSLAVAMSNAEGTCTNTVSGYTNISADTAGTLQGYSFDYKTTSATTAVAASQTFNFSGCVGLGIWQAAAASNPSFTGTGTASATINAAGTEAGSGAASAGPNAAGTGAGSGLASGSFSAAALYAGAGTASAGTNAAGGVGGTGTASGAEAGAGSFAGSGVATGAWAPAGSSTFAGTGTASGAETGAGSFAGNATVSGSFAPVQSLAFTGTARAAGSFVNASISANRDPGYGGRRQRERMRAELQAEQRAHDLLSRTDTADFVRSFANPTPVGEDVDCLALLLLLAA